ncbi:putative ribose/galactose/methyl galactoside import ATP-binding protein 1 [Amycolatopsis deserti]|uniref:Ribose/galactose/methyl galactoside import ATP-binding protein 1 n=2 Tax=Amycolatopsis deserti TaxID=185696 RepID=A0ABQ3JED5_9PSEU|nr:putative ribose/galactose/methyl galactoside import ATP-binding protein 1 [Amycolatopsis deserti]
MSTEPYLRMADIAKSFGAVHALKGVNFELRAGEVMALAGENGAGKSTLVKMLSGIHRPDSGEIRIDGRRVDIHSSRRSAEVGVAVVQQELSVVPTMTVAENVFLGNADSGQNWSGRRLAARAKEHLRTVGLDYVDPRTPAGTLSVAEQQLVEVARMIARDARILILDEPTAALSDTEIERVKAVVRSVAAEGRSVIYVTHRLGEIFELANRVTVFRNGESSPPLETAELDVDGLITKMLGRRLENMFPDRVAGRTFGATVLSVSRIAAAGLAEPISLEVRAGEIVGLAGQVGSGATPLLEAIAGARHSDSGSVTLAGAPVKSSNQHAAIRAGIAYCSGDRKRDGMFGIRPVSENLTSASLAKVTPGGWLNRARERRMGTEIAQAFSFDTKRLKALASTLSGGNQQKIVLGKWLGIEPRVLLIDEPTRGVDVGARAEIYRHLRKLADEGLAILCASSDAQEVLGLADRVGSLYRGRLVAFRDAEDVDYAQLTADITHPEGAREEVAS